MSDSKTGPKKASSRVRPTQLLGLPDIGVTELSLIVDRIVVTVSSSTLSFVTALFVRRFIDGASGYGDGEKQLLLKSKLAANWP